MIKGTLFSLSVLLSLWGYGMREISAPGIAVYSAVVEVPAQTVKNSAPMLCQTIFKNLSGYGMLGFPLGAFIIFSTLYFNKRRSVQKPGISGPEDLQPGPAVLRLEEELDSKEKELSLNALHLARMNDMMIRVTRQIRDMLPGMPTESRKKLLGIISGMEEMAASGGWKDFEMQIEHYDREFYRVLAELYPDLTPAEKRVCLFLRLNMTTKEIAAITNRSPRTIEFTRSSIRKKLQLSPEANLTTFLLSI